jgi:stearoyl-CoA desaturase (delta-9 desaturase)
MLVWGFFLSTIALHHATFTVNSLAHTWGARRYETGDHSRNNLLIAVLTLGEGWHNNHHHYPGSTRQGFYWWEFDFTYYVLWLFERLGLVWDLRPVPAEVLVRNRVDLAPREAQA